MGFARANGPKSKGARLLLQVEYRRMLYVVAVQMPFDHRNASMYVHCALSNVDLVSHSAGSVDKQDLKGNHPSQVQTQCRPQVFVLIGPPRPASVHP